MPQFVHEHRIEVENVLRMIEAPGTVLRAWSAPTVEFNVSPIDVGGPVYSDGVLLVLTVIGGRDGYLPRLAWQVSARLAAVVVGRVPGPDQTVIHPWVAVPHDGGGKSDENGVFQNFRVLDICL